jgi:hypothetical protein
MPLCGLDMLYGDSMADSPTKISELDELCYLKYFSSLFSDADIARAQFDSTHGVGIQAICYRMGI